MEDDRKIFSAEIEVPDIVKQKADDAFAKIKMEGAKQMKSTQKHNNTTKNKKNIFRSQAAAVVFICLIAVAGTSAVAAIHHIWGRAMQGALQATDEQQQILTQQGMATVFTEPEQYDDLAVTVGDVTVAPDTVIVDDRFAYLSFSVNGYELEAEKEPCFESMDVYVGDDPDSENSWVNSYGNFYYGIVTDENGNPVYDDGTPVQFDENGSLIYHYTDENGTLEFVILAWVAGYNDSLLGKTMHVNFDNLGTAQKSDYVNDVEGNWSFAIDLPSVSTTKNIAVNERVGDTVFVLDSIEISPISIKMNYSVNGAVTMMEDENGVPDFCGVVLKDGTRLPYISDGGSTGYTDDTMTKAYVLSAFDRIIDSNQVKSVLVRTKAGTDMIEVPVRN